MLKVKVRWQGFTGSPGWSNFYFDGPDDATFEGNADAIEVAERVRVFFNAIKGHFPATVQWAIQSDVDQVHANSGEMFGVESIPPIAPFGGTAVAGPHSGASGIVITWRTGGVRNGRRVRGRTFLVPTSNNAFANDGTLDNSVQTVVGNAATTLAATVGGIGLGVWSRPTGPAATDGDWHIATGATVPDMAAILRSRRD